MRTFSFGVLMPNKYPGQFVPQDKLSPITNAPPVDTPGLRLGVSTGGRFVPHGGTSKPMKHYTGDKLIGISIRHKSGLEPVFDPEQAKALALMRR